jgi:hypothetical protein
VSGTVWSKFYWSDWDSDPAVRHSSLAAQGLWMRMLCIAAAHDPIGYVAVAGKGLDETSLARLTGCQESEVISLLGELERNGVFSRDRHGRIYSRRMILDARKAAIAKKNGKSGGNPSLSKQRGNEPSDNPTDKAQDNPHKPSAKSPKEKASAFSGRASAQKPSGFVHVRKMTSAVSDFIEGIDNDQRGIEDHSAGSGSDVSMLPAVRVG